MSINTLTTPPLSDTRYNDDEIDLRQYIDVAIRWWREIVLITVGVTALAALTILVLRWVLPPSFVASADVAIVRTVSDVSFDERFVTTSDQVGLDVTSARARRSALLRLIATGGIANEVILELGSLLDDEERDPALLIKRVTAEVDSQFNELVDSDLIRISLAADTPEKASALTNAWAKAYVRQVNLIYGQVPDGVLTSIESERAKAEQIYLSSQAALETFISSSRVDELTGLTAALQQQVNQEVALVQALLGSWQKAIEHLSAVRALRTQVNLGGEAAARSNMVALQALKLAIYGFPAGELHVELRDFPEVTQAAMLTDVDGLITSLEQRISELDSEITARNNHLRQPTATLQTSVPISSPLLSATYEELRFMKAEIEAETARRQQLEQRRNLDFEAYKALNSKVAELNLARAAASSEVRFAAPAIPPVEPVEGVGLLIGTAIAAMLGAVLAILYALFSNYLGQSPFLKRST